VPAGESVATITVAGAGDVVDVRVRAFSPRGKERESVAGFVESDGIVAIEAEHFTRAVDAGESRWIRIEDYGHTLSGMRAEGPVDTGGLTPGRNSPSLEYGMYRFSTGPAEVELTVAPTLNFVPDRALRVAVSFDDAEPEILTLVPEGYDAANGNRDWEESVRNNYRLVTSRHTLDEPGEHTLRLWMIDPAVIVQRIVVRDTDRARPSTYLGPPESYRN
jgi:predicted RNA-binding protein with TRAM domain